MTFRFWFYKNTAPFLAKKPSIYAACAAYYFLISLLPASAFLVSIISHFPKISKEVFGQFFPLVPEPLHPVLKKVLSNILCASFPAAMSISGLIALWSSSKGLQTIMRGMKYMMDVHETRNWLQRRLFSIVMLLFCFLFLIATAGSLILAYWLVGSIPGSVPLSLLPLPAFLSVLYRLLSDRQIKYSHCLVSSCLTSFVVFFYSLVYSIYVQWFSSYDDFFGEIGAFVLTLLWLHGLLVIVLLGCRMAKLLSEGNYHPLSELFCVVQHHFK